MKKNILLIFPNGFYNFCNLFINELCSRGYNVDQMDDLYPTSNLIKGISRLYPNLIYGYTKHVIKGKLINSNSNLYDYIIIIRGKGISRSLIEFLKSKFSAKIIAYNWDSFLNNPTPLKWYMIVDSYYTFDYKDAEQFKIPIIDLFASKSLESDAIQHQRVYVSAIISNHSKRLSYLDKCLSLMKNINGVIPYIYIYEKSYALGFYTLIRSPRLFLKYYKYIHFKPMLYEDYIGVLKKSILTIDYAHEQQTGLTMRCFEAIASGSAIITNNEYIKASVNISNHDYFLFPNSYFDIKVLNSFVENKKKIKVKSKPRTINLFFDQLLKN